jgi:hypothetical protein
MRAFCLVEEQDLGATKKEQNPERAKSPKSPKSRESEAKREIQNPEKLSAADGIKSKSKSFFRFLLFYSRKTAEPVSAILRAIFCTITYNIVIYRTV